MATEAQTCAIACTIGGISGKNKSVSIRVNSWLNTKIAHFESIMQNKPNLLNAQMNISSALTKYYENEHLRRRGENKANTKPIKANTKPIPEKPK